MPLSSKIIKDALLESNPSFGNAVCSPTSLLFLLSVLSKYEEGEVKNEIESILNNFGFDREKLIESINNIKEATLHVHSSLWYDENYTLKEKELPLLEKIGCDFVNESTFKDINAWVDEKTKGLISKIDLPRGPLLSVLINVVYLKCFWQNKFITPWSGSDFKLLNGKTKKVGYLGKSFEEEIGYIKEEEFEALVIPYKGKNLQFEIYLPKEDILFQDFIYSLDKIDFQKIVNKFSFTTNYGLCFPKFEISCNMDLMKVLKSSNFNKIFEERKSPYFNEDVLENYELFQVAKIKVNEEGTEAAAVTYGLGGINGVPPEPEVQFIADRPFFFLIRELGSNSLLFTGILTEPPKFEKRLEEPEFSKGWLRNILEFFKILPRQ